MLSLRVPAQAVLLSGLLAALPARALDDLDLRRTVWWASLPFALFTALALEAFIDAVWRLLRGLPRDKVRARMVVAGTIAAVVAGALTSMSAMVMFAVAATALALALAGSLRADKQRRRAVARLAFVLVSAAWMGWRTYPPNVPTGRLVGLSLLTPRQWEPEPRGWVEEELVHRADAVPFIERRLAEQARERGPGAVPSRSELVLLRLHRLAGGDAGFRARWCQGRDLDHFADRYESRDTFGRPVPDPTVAAALCGRGAAER